MNTNKNGHYLAYGPKNLVKKSLIYIEPSICENHLLAGREPFMIKDCSKSKIPVAYSHCMELLKNSLRELFFIHGKNSEHIELCTLGTVTYHFFVNG